MLTIFPKAPLTKEGRVIRRARVGYLLMRRGTPDPALEAFVDDDIDEVVGLFQDVNDGTHGKAGRYDVTQLSAIKHRVEDTIRFLYRISTPDAA